MKKILFMSLLMLSFCSKAQRFPIDDSYYWILNPKDQIFIGHDVEYWIKENKVKKLSYLRGTNPAETDVFLFSRKGYLTEHQFWWKNYDSEIDTSAVVKIIKEKSFDHGDDNVRFYTVETKKGNQIGYGVLYDKDSNLIYEARSTGAFGEYSNYENALSLSIKFDEEKKFTERVGMGSGYRSYDTIHYQRCRYNFQSNSVKLTVWDKEHPIDEQLTRSDSLNLKHVIIDEDFKIFDTINLKNNQERLNTYLRYDNVDLFCAPYFSYLSTLGEPLKDEKKSVIVVHKFYNWGFGSSVTPKHYRLEYRELISTYNSSDLQATYCETCFPRFFMNEIDSIQHIEKKYVLTDTTFKNKELYELIKYDLDGKISEKYRCDSLIFNEKFYRTYTIKGNWQKEVYVYNDGVLSGIHHYAPKKEYNKEIADPSKLRYKLIKTDDFTKPSNIEYLNENKTKVKIGDFEFEVEYWK